MYVSHQQEKSKNRRTNEHDSCEKEYIDLEKEGKKPRIMTNLPFIHNSRYIKGLSSLELQNDFTREP